MSGSWDGTARIWDIETGKVKETLTGHRHAVSVLSLPNGIVITGSQDKKIRLWFRGKLEKEIEGHQDIVRGFTEVPQMNAFASCSNDEVVKLWSLDGTHLADYKGHRGFVLAVDTLESGELVSAGDDCTVKIWDNETAECKQTIQMPGSAWSVTHNKKGDLLVGCEDKSIRTFTRDWSRRCEDSEYLDYQDDCKNSTQTIVPDLKSLKDYNAEVKGIIKGSKQGEMKVFSDKGVAKAYMWQDKSQSWDEIGEMVTSDRNLI